MTEEELEIIINHLIDSENGERTNGYGINNRRSRQGIVNVPLWNCRQARNALSIQRWVAGCCGLFVTAFRRWLISNVVSHWRVSSDALFLFMRFLCVAHALSMRFYKPKAPQTRPSELHLQSTVDKLSSSYVLVFNVSTVNLGRVNMDFGSFFCCMA